MRPNRPAFRAGRGAQYLDPVERDESDGRAEYDEPIADLPFVVGIHIDVLFRGRQVALLPEDLDQVELYDLEETHRPVGYTNKRELTGKVPALSPRRTFLTWEESDLERDHLTWLRWESYDELNTQCMRLRWDFADGSVKEHTPDFILRRAGATTIVDISEDDQTDLEKALDFDFTSETCRALGWSYEVGTRRSLGRKRRANVNFLFGACHLDVEAIHDRPRTYRGLAELYGGGGFGRMCARAALWRRHHFIDMTRPLNDISELVPNPPRPARFPWRRP